MNIFAAWLVLAAPPDDLSRFPPPAVVDMQVRYLTARRAWLSSQVDLHGGDEWWGEQYRSAEEDAYRRWNAWATLQVVQKNATIKFPATLTEEYLEGLRGQIGSPAFEMGDMPGPIAPQYIQRQP